MTKEMNIDFQTSMHESFLNESGRRVTVSEAQTKSIKRYYYVVVREPGQNGETVATRCTHEQAMQIAREYYFK